MRLQRNWFWGTFFLVGAVLLVVGQLGLLPVRFGFWQLLVGIFLVAMLVYNLAHRSIGGSVFSLAFLAIVFAKPLGITALVPWTILGAALFLTIGLSLLVSPRHFFRYETHTTFHHGDATERVDRMTTDESQVRVNVNMGNSIRYLQSQDFQRADINVRMGNAKLYFDEVQVAPTGAVINLNVSLGGVELYFPRTWNVKLNVDPSLGGVEVKGAPVASAGPTVVVQGHVSLSGVTVVYA
ncbi:LiaF transmembrane domain-containing protein [Levilactobacillus spicheri]